MPVIEFEKITKRFGDQVAVSEFNATIPDNEFLVLLGPSGCGKSTMLRMIAGLTDISDGDLKFDGRRINEVPAKARNVAFVFQSYALYPHMSVRGNLSFPLVMSRFRPWHHLPILNGFVKRRLMRDTDIRRKVEEVAAMMDLTDLLDRRPGTLSGGQRQRVAVGRALVRNPALYLLDEPLSNLDAVLRNQMRTEITELYRNVGKSFIYVTHDQIEAMTMGTRIVVLNKGSAQQIGTPEEIFERPANVFVAKFIGTPPMNLFSCVVDRGHLILDGTSIPLPSTVRPLVADGGTVLVGVRAEQVSIARDADPTRPTIEAHVIDVEYLGTDAMVAFRLGRKRQHGLVPHDVAHARVPLGHGLRPDDTCHVELDLTRASFFDAESGNRIGE